MDTEIKYKYTEDGSEITSFATMHKGIYSSLIGKSKKVHKLLKYSRLTAQGYEDCSNFLDYIKETIGEEYEEFNELYSQLKQKRVYFFEITKY